MIWLYIALFCSGKYVCSEIPCKIDLVENQIIKVPGGVHNSPFSAAFQAPFRRITCESC